MFLSAISLNIHIMQEKFGLCSTITMFSISITVPVLGKYFSLFKYLTGKITVEFKCSEQLKMQNLNKTHKYSHTYQIEFQIPLYFKKGGISEVQCEIT